MSCSSNSCSTRIFFRFFLLFSTPSINHYVMKFAFSLNRISWLLFPFLLIYVLLIIRKIIYFVSLSFLPFDVTYKFLILPYLSWIKYFSYFCDEVRYLDLYQDMCLSCGWTKNYSLRSIYKLIMYNKQRHLLVFDLTELIGKQWIIFQIK